MPDVRTPNYALWKPGIDEAADYWGQLLNQNADIIDIELLNRLNKAPGAGQQIVQNQLTLTAQPGQTGDQNAATVGWVAAYVATQISDARIYANQRIADYMNWIFPIHTVIMWNGTSNGPFPPGWALCNGNPVGSYGNTPNLVDRFILGAAPAGSWRGDTGGYQSNPSWHFEHLHHSQRVYSGPATNPYMQAMWANEIDQGVGAAPQPPIAVPYYVLAFLVKYRNIVPADVG